MSLQLRGYGNTSLSFFNERLLEQILFELGELFDIRIIWDGEATLLATTLAIVGGIFGNFVGGRVGATLGAGLGGAAGFATSKLVSLREVWESVKEQLKPVLYMIYNYLRSLDASDYMRAFEIFVASTSPNKKEFINKIIEFIASTLGRQAVSACL